MIQNERQYRITRAQLAHFSQALVHLETHRSELHPIGYQVQHDAITSQMESFEQELRRFDDLRYGRVQLEPLDLLERLPTLLIELRIAAGLTQQELGRVMGIHEEQIRRYEKSGYSAASLERVLGIVRACRARLKVPLYRSSESSYLTPRLENPAGRLPSALGLDRFAA